MVQPTTTESCNLHTASVEFATPREAHLSRQASKNFVPTGSARRSPGPVHAGQEWRHMPAFIQTRERLRVGILNTTEMFREHARGSHGLKFQRQLRRKKKKISQIYFDFE